MKLLKRLGLLIILCLSVLSLSACQNTFFGHHFHIHMTKTEAKTNHYVNNKLYNGNLCLYISSVSYNSSDNKVNLYMNRRTSFVMNTTSKAYRKERENDRKVIRSSIGKLSRKTDNRSIKYELIKTNKIM